MSADVTITDVIPDDAELRAARRERVLEAMAAAGVDVLITGREPNARYVAGVPRLWINGSRPFGPGCVIERATGSIHIVSTWDEGVPDDIPHENLHGITFNRANTLAWLTQVEGAATAKTVATDGLMPSTLSLIRQAFPSAEVVDGEQLMAGVRRMKLPEEIRAIRTSVRIAEHALDAAEASLGAGMTGRRLTAAFMEAMADAGVTTPTTQDVAWITGRDIHWSQASRDSEIAVGDLVAFDAGLMADGYVGEIGRTRSVGGLPPAARKLRQRWDELWDRLVDGCRAGASAVGLLDAYDASGATPPPVPIARGLGLGNDLPFVTGALRRTAADQKLEAGMVLALTAYVWEEGVGAIYGQEPVVITADGPELLSTNPFRKA
ncbi:MAG TPA: M24 family metallopeptidase [Mycobacteriales bacterium]|nr:M24 family metallopeptidase [Mycobacteriales bacterium]